MTQIETMIFDIIRSLPALGQNNLNNENIEILCQKISVDL